MLFVNKLLSDLRVFPLVLLLVASPLFAAELTGGTEPKFESKEIIKLLKQGGYVVYFRHGSTEKVGEKDVPAGQLSDCSTQRNLSEKGREQAKGIGQAFKKLDIPVGNVYTSPYCRCVDTANLAFGKYEKSDNLYFAIHLPPEQREPVNAKLREMLSQKPKGANNTIIVSHTGNLKGAVGIWPKKEADAYIFKPDGAGNFSYIGVISADGWI